MRWTASNQYQEDKRMGRVVGQGEHDSQLLRMLEDTNENKREEKLRQKITQMDMI